MSQKPLIFISHITEEKEIAFALKTELENGFLEIIKVFVSSDSNNIHAGQEWLQQIQDALKTCAVEIILASPESVVRPWINFEAGAGWIRGIPVIPLCHSGMTFKTLPTPLNNRQAVIATDASSLKNIVTVIANASQCKPPVIDFTRFINAVSKHEIESVTANAVAKKHLTPPIDGIQQFEIDAIISIADESDPTTDATPFYSFRKQMDLRGYSNWEALLAVRLLERRSFVNARVLNDWQGGDYKVLELSAEAWNWIGANKNSLTDMRVTDASSPPPPDEYGVPF